MNKQLIRNNVQNVCQSVKHHPTHSHLGFPVVEEVVELNVAVDDPKLVDVFEGFQQVVDVQTNLLEAQQPDDLLRDKRRLISITIVTRVWWKLSQ